MTQAPTGNSTAGIRLLIVDDHVIVRKGIRALLAETAGIEVVGEASDGRAAVAQAEALRPDVILMDLAMPEMDGIEATRLIKASRIVIADDQPRACQGLQALLATWPEIEVVWARWQMARKPYDWWSNASQMSCSWISGCR